MSNCVSNKDYLIRSEMMGSHCSAKFSFFIHGARDSIAPSTSGIFFSENRSIPGNRYFSYDLLISEYHLEFILLRPSSIVLVPYRYPGNSSVAAGATVSSTVPFLSGCGTAPFRNLSGCRGRNRESSLLRHRWRAPSGKRCPAALNV